MIIIYRNRIDGNDLFPITNINFFFICIDSSLTIYNYNIEKEFTIVFKKFLLDCHKKKIPLYIINTWFWEEMNFFMNVEIWINI